MTAVSSLLTEPPTITLTANTTGGPPGNVQWTIDGAAIPDSTATVNIDSDSTSDRGKCSLYPHTDGERETKWCLQIYCFQQPYLTCSLQAAHYHM